MTEKSRYWSPSRTYEFILKIGNIDLTPDLISLSIISSIEMPYQTFLLDIFTDSNELIREKIYGQTPLKLTANLLATEQYPLESIDFELLFLNSNLDLESKVQIPENTQRDRTRISITAVPKNAYITMNYIVNNVYQATTVQSIISDLVSTTGATLKFDSSNANLEKIDQVLIPATTLYKNLIYINKLWGIYDGLPSITCSYDNVVKIKNLTSKMNKAQGFTVYQLATDSDNSKEIESSNDGKKFYTIRPIKSKYEGTSTFAYLGPKIVYLVKPGDRLSHQITIDTEQFSKTYGLISKNTDIFFDKTTIQSDKRISYIKNHTGYELDDTFINSNKSKQIASITEVELVLERSLRILNLMDVGESVQITSKTTSSTEVLGRYILQHSELTFTKAKDWESSAAIKLIRTNRSMT